MYTKHESTLISINNFFYLLLLLFISVFPLIAKAQATLFISPANGTYEVGERFTVLINVNSGGKAINASSGLVNFDNTRLEVADMGYSRSIFTLWTEEPTFSNVGGTIRFSGGLPNPGYTGAAGAMLRVTFRAKSTGQAPVVFSSGAVLANDGLGTNILDTLNTALYNIVPAKIPVELKTKEEAPITPVPSIKIVKKELEAPKIVSWPKEVEEGSIFTLQGLGYPNGKISIFIQKNSESPTVAETFAGPDGQFSYTYGEKAKLGFYRFWMKSSAPDGRESGLSEIIVIEVKSPLFFRIGTLALDYISIIVTLLALLLLAVIIIIWSWYRFRKWQTTGGREIAEAEKVLHRSFDTLKDGLAAYLHYLIAAKSPKDIESRERQTEQELKKELEHLEKDIEKEIEDINPHT